MAIDIPLQEQAMVGPEYSLAQDRSDAMQNIESMIVELGGIFQQLAGLIHEQGESLQRIDANITDTVGWSSKDFFPRALGK